MKVANAALRTLNFLKKIGFSVSDSRYSSLRHDSYRHLYPAILRTQTDRPWILKGLLRHIGEQPLLGASGYSMMISMVFSINSLEFIRLQTLALTGRLLNSGIPASAASPNMITCP